MPATRQTKQQLRVKLRDLLPKCRDYEGYLSADYAINEINYVLRLLSLIGRDTTTAREGRECVITIHRRLYWHLHEAEIKHTETDSALPTILSFFDAAFPENSKYARMVAYSSRMLEEEE